MSLADAAKALDLAPNGVRSRFKAGKIKGERDNQGRIWVWVDMNAANEASSKRLRQKVTRDDDAEPVIRALEGHIEDLRAQNRKLTDEVAAVKTERDQERAERVMVQTQMINLLAAPRSRPTFWAWLTGKS